MVAFLTTCPLVDRLARSWQQFSCLSELLNNPDDDAAVFVHDIKNVSANDDLLSRRMCTLGFDRSEAVRFRPDIIPELQKSCVACNSRTQCDADLNSVSLDGDGVPDQTWQDYCPNVATLKMLSSLLPATR